MNSVDTNKTTSSLLHLMSIPRFLKWNSRFQNVSPDVAIMTTRLLFIDF